MSRSSSTNNGRNRAVASRGAAMVEMAILIALLVVLFIGITEIGRALFFQHKLTKSAESGVRYLARAWDAVDTSNCSASGGWAAGSAGAANLAATGTASGGGDPIIPGFAPGNVSASVISREVDEVGTVCVVRVDIAVPYDAMFLGFGSGGGGGFLPPIVLGGDGAGWTLTAASEERYVGD